MIQNRGVKSAFFNRKQDRIKSIKNKNVWFWNQLKLGKELKIISGHDKQSRCYISTVSWMITALYKCHLYVITAGDLSLLQVPVIIGSHSTQHNNTKLNTHFLVYISLNLWLPLSASSHPFLLLSLSLSDNKRHGWDGWPPRLVNKHIRY